MSLKSVARLLAAFSVVFCFTSVPLANAATSPAPDTHGLGSLSTQAKFRKAEASIANVPLNFEPNRGQTSSQVQWLSRGPEFTLYLAGHDAVLEMNTITRGKDLVDPPKVTSTALRMNLLGSSSARPASGESPLPGKANYFTGADPAHWQREVPTFAKVRLPSVYPGVDLLYYGHNGHLEYDFIVAPQADASQIRFGFDGATPDLATDGDLTLDIAGKHLSFNRPVAYQTLNGTRQLVPSSFEIAADGNVRFRLGKYDHSRELVIDPVLVFLGAIGSGNQQTIAYGMAVDTSGDIILTGVTNDLAFPTTSGAFQPTCGNPAGNQFPPRCGASSASDAFITKLSGDGQSLVFSTYLSGTQFSETGYAVAVDPAGVIYAVGTTNSNDFPITSDAYQKLCSPGGMNFDFNTDVYTTIGAYCYGPVGSGQYGNGQQDTYLVKLSPAGALLYGTFIGGTNNDAPTGGIALDAAGNIYIAGASSSGTTTYPANSGISYPISYGAFQSSGITNGFDITLSKFSNDGHNLIYSTFLGSTQNTQYNDFSQALSLGTNGIAFVGGYTGQSTFPTTNGALSPQCVVNNNSVNGLGCTYSVGFVSAFDTTKVGNSSLVYSTDFYAPSVNTTNIPATSVQALLADSSNNLLVSGYTTSASFPTTQGAYQTSCYHANSANSCETAFVTRIDPTGTAILNSTFYGGTQAYPNAGNALATDSKGDVYLYGSSNTGGNVDLPVLNPLQNPQMGGDKIFIAAFSSDLTQLHFATRFGSSTVPTNEEPVLYGGLALDGFDNIYFSGLSNGDSLPITSGAYHTTSTGGFNRTFFGKIFALLPATTTTLSISPSTTVNGQTVTFTATVAGVSQNSPSPTGSVTLTDTGTNTVLGTITLGVGGSGSFSTSSLSVGSYSVVATYSGDSVYDTSSSAPSTLTINTPVPDTVSLTASATSITSGSPVTFNVTVAGPQGGMVPTGTVYFYDGVNYLGSVMLANGAASYTTSALPAGTNSVSASYSGDNIFGAASSAAQTVNVTASATGLQFIPVTPCRVADTRGAPGLFGGPELGAGTTNEFDIPQSACGIPTTAVAYSLNVTVVPDSTLNYLTLWPSGLNQPYVSTLNSDGRIKANAAITPAGLHGGINIFVSDAANVILDIDGYFVPAGTASALAFHQVLPCRVSDTRSAAGPLGGPFIAGNTHRDFPVQSSSCGIPANAQAYSLNVTAVPHSILNYLTAWPTGQTQPYVSTLNALTGAIAANAAIVPAATNGDVSIFVSDDADVILDINGYFAPALSSGLSLYTTTPCRVFDSRSTTGTFNGSITIGVGASSCAVPSTAVAFVLNATVVPLHSLNYLTLWSGSRTQPFVSTLNAPDGAITSNMAIVPTSSGNIKAFASDPTDLILDLSSYFAP